MNLSQNGKSGSESDAENRHIVAIGGNGLSRQADGLAFARYLLALSGRDKPRIALLATATGDADAAIVRFHEACGVLDCKAMHIPLFRRTPELETVIPQQDIIYVGGGNTRSMLATWREWGLPELLRSAWEAGTVLAGVSAGAICWFEQGVTDSMLTRLHAMDCLGFLPGSCCPHYSGEAERRPAYRDMVGNAIIGGGYAIDDGAALHFSGTELHRVIATGKGAQAWRVELQGDQVTETALPALRLDRHGRCRQ